MEMEVAINHVAGNQSASMMIDKNGGTVLSKQ